MNAGRKFKLFIVDDEPDITAVLKIGLESEGFDVQRFRQDEVTDIRVTISRA